MNSVALLFMFFIMMKVKGRDNTLTFPNVNKVVDLDIKNTTEKIRMIRKIGPYFPEEYLPSVNKAIMITERIVKLHEAFEFMKEKDSSYITESIPIENHQQRLGYIANIIQKDFTEDEIKRLGSAADIILKMDKYNKMMNMLGYITSNPDALKDTNSMFKLIEPLFQGKDDKDMKKIKEMSKMMNILKALDTPKSQKDKKDKRDGKKGENL